MQEPDTNNNSSNSGYKGNVTDHMANERTFLAWIRTGVGIMAFGFVVVKFSLFVKQIAFIFNEELPATNKGYASLLGISLVIVGLLVSLCSYIQYRRNTKQIVLAAYKPSSMLSFMLMLCILSIGVLLVGYLIYSYNL